MTGELLTRFSHLILGCSLGSSPTREGACFSQLQCIAKSGRILDFYITIAY